MTDEETVRSRESWGAAAAGWEAQRERVWAASAPVGEAIVAALDPQPGQTLLELAAGPGDTGFTAALLLGPAGLLISSDLAPEMVDAARRRGAELGLENVEYRVLDAQALDLPDGSIDGILCRWGYMLMPDPLQALRETRRVLRDGGRLSFAVWGPRGRNRWATAIGRSLLAVGLMEPPDPLAPGMFALADTGRLADLIVTAGFEPPAIAEVVVSWRYDSFDEYVEVQTSLSRDLRSRLEELDAAARTQVLEATREQLQPYANDAGYTIDGVSLVVSAR